MPSRTFRLLVLIAGLTVFDWLPSASSAGCQPGDFIISHVRTSWDTNPGAVTITGIITNKCAEAAGPELKWTAYYSDGSVAFSKDFWPASTVNSTKPEVSFREPEISATHQMEVQTRNH